MNDVVAEKLVGLMREVSVSIAKIQIQPWACDLSPLTPANPTDFHHFVHFVEGLCAAYSAWFRYLETQGTHDPVTLHAAGEALVRLATETRMEWEIYKNDVGIRAA